MKKGFALLLTVCIFFSAAAFAEEADPAQEAYIPRRVPLTAIEWEPVKVEQENGNVEYEAVYKNGSLDKLEVETETEDGVEYEIRYDAAGNILRAEYETGDSEIVYNGSVWRDKDGAEAEGPDLSVMQHYFTDYKLERIICWHNTMSLVGLPLRELVPGLTDKWYHVVPVDLSKEGVFLYPTAVSSMYLMGSCEVTVHEGKVTVDYVLPEGYVYPGDQCMSWFTSLEEITAEFLDAPESSFRFGQPVDIRTELNGQEIALLFICNDITYQLPVDYKNSFPASVHPLSPEMLAYRQELLDLIEQMQ